MPDDAALLAYADLHDADGQAADADSGSSVRAHVARCTACQVRVRQLQREQQTLQALLHRAGCPSVQELGEHHLTLLNAPRAGEVAAHLGFCPACRAEVQDLATFIARLRRPLSEAAEDLFSSLRTIAARLATGPMPGPTLALTPALRGAGDEVARAPLVYTAEDVLVTVDSWVERAGQPGRVVAGLVVGPVDFAGAEASMDEAAAVSRVPINHLGNILFSEVSPGRHDLLIRLPATGIQIAIDELLVQ